MQRSRAFTLIEVLVALAVLAIGLAALVRGASDYTSNAAALRQRAVAGWVAENQLTEMELAKEWPREGSHDGSEKMAGAEWQWQAQVEETPNPDIRHVTVEVRRADHEAVLARLQGFVANPRAAGTQ